MCVCVYVSSHLFRTSDFWTHQPGSHRISPPSFCGTCLNFYREKDSAVSFPRQPRCAHDLIVLHLLGMFLLLLLLLLFLLGRKNPQVRRIISIKQGRLICLRVLLISSFYRDLIKALFCYYENKIHTGLRQVSSSSGQLKRAVGAEYGHISVERPALPPSEKHPSLSLDFPLDYT